MSRSPNIAVIVPYVVYPAKMGGQKGIALFYEYLSKRIPVKMISTGKQTPELFAGTFHQVLGNSKFRYVNPAVFFRLKKLLGTSGVTHLILEHPYFGWLGIMLQKASNLKLIIHSHNIEALRFKSMRKWWWKILWNYERITHRHADINFFITDEDREFAMYHFNLKPEKCHTITYGIEIKTLPPRQEKILARQQLQAMHGIEDDEHILFFNGTLSYPPNLQAINNIIKHINPLLMQHPTFRYKIIICGKGLPSAYDELKSHRSTHLLYAGFVDDISVYFKGADIFLNPVVDGGGIKTKLVEALGYNNSVVSTASGAIGVNLQITGSKLKIVADNDWTSFAEQVLEINILEETPMAFYNHFYWGNIADKALHIIQQA